MDLLAFEHDRGFVLKALRRGEIDYLEPVTESVEADFFRQLIDRQVLERLAESYPTPRQKQEVPVWLYLASELTLKLHGAQGYHAYPRLLRSGGLIDAAGIGYRANEGPGRGQSHEDGGSYGGDGGDNPGWTYGSRTTPTEPGSGGGFQGCGKTILRLVG